MSFDRVEHCVICEVIAGKVHAEKVWENDRFFCFMIINPVSDGHVLVIPKWHIDYLFDMAPSDSGELMQACRTVALGLKVAMGSPKIGVAVEGFGVRHVHVHLHPVSRSGDLDPCRVKTADPEQLRELGARVKGALES